MLAEWPVHEPAPTNYWFSDLPADAPLKTLVRLAKTRWRIEHDYRELKTALGLDHFEGRSINGFHRHLTLVTAAQFFITRKRLAPPTGPGAGPSGPRRTFHSDGRCPGPDSNRPRECHRLGVDVCVDSQKH
ncbi:transposase [Arthrobacter dokdonensis]|uniref:transposase n=1 Tax=Arthrobacter dokdonellae TaxID=2211210 RepID=UPI000DE5B521